MNTNKEALMPATKKSVNGTINRIASVVEVPQIELVNLQIKLVGDSPLVTHAWSDKAKKMMQMGKLMEGRGKKKMKKVANNYNYN